MNALIALIGGWRATAFLAFALAALMFAGAEHVRLATAQRDLAQRDADIAAARESAAHDARLKDAQLANAASNADAQYARGMTDAQSAADALALALRAGDVRLRAPWRCEAAAADRLPAPAADQRRADDPADDRAKSAGRIIGAAAACDAQVAALQGYIRDARCIVNAECAP